ncbi:MAG: sugar phosphate isomerase/epimerase [Casimicrobiaceae bacterium]|nr:sugar phosphate isomerase/epimerase [Casimicrobiaceae bacterium]
MRRDWPPVERFGMDTISLAGTLEVKLEAMARAGFRQVMLSARDVVGHPAGVSGAARAVAGSGLTVTGFQVLRDFEGLDDQLHAYKLDIAKAMIEMAAAVGAPLLLTCSSVSRHATGAHERLAEDLHKLAMLALPFGIRVAYEALSWGLHVSDYRDAWAIVRRVDCPTLTLALDSFHMLATASPFEELSEIDPERISLVQLSDFMWQEVRTAEERLTTARTFRVFPYEGVHSSQLLALIQALEAMGYTGPYSFEVFNDDYTQLPPRVVAERARTSARRLAETVLAHREPPVASA